MSSVLNYFVPSNSIIHNLDPRIKFLSYLTLLTMIFLWPNHFFLYFVYLIGYSLIFFLAKLKFSRLRPIFFSLLIVFVFLFVFNLIQINAGTSATTEQNEKFFGLNNEIAELGPIHLTWSTIMKTIFYTLRIFLVIFLTFIFSATTSSYEITFAIASLLSPLKLIGFPVVIFATIVSLTLRLVPTLVQEGRIILDAQSSRGLDFATSGLRTKIKISVALIIPLLVSIFKKAGEMANAMESRGYNPNQERSTYQQFAIRWLDWLVFLLVIIFFVLNVLFISLIVSHWSGSNFGYFFVQFNQLLENGGHDHNQ